MSENKELRVRMEVWDPDGGVVEVEHTYPTRVGPDGFVPDGAIADALEVAYHMIRSHYATADAT